MEGFRFDLMGLMDIETAAEIMRVLKQQKTDIFVYGEPWAAGATASGGFGATDAGWLVGPQADARSAETASAAAGPNHLLHRVVIA